MRHYAVGLGLVTVALGGGVGLDRISAALPAIAAELGQTLEAQVAATTAALSCAAVDASFDDGNNVHLTGHVGSEQDLANLRQSLGQIQGLGTIESDLEVDPWPTCELLAVLAPYRQAAAGSEPGLTITTASRETRLREGDDLTLDISLPRMARYLYLGYVQHDGRVGYIATLPVRAWAEGKGAVRFATGFQISAPYGREMIVAVTSAHPLFEQPRPGYEPAGDYIEALRQRLAALQAGEPAGSVAVSHLFIMTEPKGSL
jgi:eukaryotic-like serine/threonine-protein kinase